MADQYIQKLVALADKISELAKAHSLDDKDVIVDLQNIFDRGADAVLYGVCPYHDVILYGPCESCLSS